MNRKPFFFLLFLVLVLDLIDMKLKCDSNIVAASTQF